MTSDEILDALEAIKAVGGNEKKALLKRYDHSALRMVLEAGTNPFWTYGIKKVDVPSPGTGQFAKSTWGLLGWLRERSLTGQAAQDAVVDELGRLSLKSQDLLIRILNKKLDAGIQASTINAVFPNLIPTFDCMLAQKYDSGRIKKWPVSVEPKLDGVRVLAFVNGSEVQFFSRSGKEFTTFEHLKPEIIAMWRYANDRWGPVVFDGEMVSGSFNKTVSEVRRKSEQATDAKFYVFDAIDQVLFDGPKNSKGGMSYKLRREVLREVVAAHEMRYVILNQSYLVSTPEEIDHYYRRFRAQGLEGAIVKDRLGLYERKRSYGWMKIKAQESVDVPIVGFEEGAGKYQGMLGALIVDHDGIRVNVGTGLSDDQRTTFWRHKEELIDRLAEVEYHEVTPDGSLRHPRFIRFRDDKSPVI